MIIKKRMLMSKKTVGEIVHENNSRNLQLEDDVGAYSEAMAPQILNELANIVDEARQSHWVYQEKDFYVVMIKTINRLTMQPHFKYFTRLSCPTPVYNQDVWKFKHREGTLEFLWCIPDMSRYMDILSYPQKYLQSKDTERLAKFVLLMESGQLLQWAKKENRELKDAVIMVNKGEA